MTNTQIEDKKIDTELKVAKKKRQLEERSTELKNFDGMMADRAKR